MLWIGVHPCIHLLRLLNDLLNQRKYYLEYHVGKSSTKIKNKTLGDIKIKGIGGEEDTFKNNKNIWSVIQGRNVRPEKLSHQARKVKLIEWKVSFGFHYYQAVGSTGTILLKCFARNTWECRNK